MYHLHVKTVSRKTGRSSVAAAAYRSCQKLQDRYLGVAHDYTHKTGIVHSEILLPANAPLEFLDREILWNAVEKAERRADARTAREVEVALPRELTVSERLDLVRCYVTENFIAAGMCADVAFHSGKVSDNPHAHILLTTRSVGPKGFSNRKNRNWDKRENVSRWRDQWAKFLNKEFERKGLAIRVSGESYIKQGIDREPTKHLGHRVTQLERSGRLTGRGDENRRISARNIEKEKRAHLLQIERDRNLSRKLTREISR